MDRVTVHGYSHPHHPDHFIWLREQELKLAEMIGLELEKASNLFDRIKSKE